ncbi:MAG: hypothetical protein KDC00_15075 [Flavobacteriales bacterium]|nr:hypothetical protein [Flavobacteriales bacterium]
MSKVIATNGSRVRSMGLIELKNNPDWREATADEVERFKNNATAPAPSGVKPVREPMRLDTVPTPEPEKVIERPVVEATPEGLAQAEEQAREAEQEPTEPRKPLNEVIRLIKQATTAEVVDELIRDEDRKTVLDVAAKHKQKIAKA